MAMKPEQYKQFKEYRPMLDQLAADGFHSVAEYESATAQYSRRSRGCPSSCCRNATFSSP
jgi:hypothetical protein